MDGELEFDEATVRSVAAALRDSASELSLLADQVETRVSDEGSRLAEVVRQWVERTAADASRLSAAADLYAHQDAAIAQMVEMVGRVES